MTGGMVQIFTSNDTLWKECDEFNLMVVNSSPNLGLRTKFGSFQPLLAEQ